MRRVERLDSYQRTHPWLGFPIAVVYKFADDQGGFLAALIAYYAFVSIFPLLLLVVTVLGFVLQGNPSLQQDVLGSAVTDLPVIGQQLVRNVNSFRGSGLGLAVGVLGTLYGALGFAQAAQNALNRAWAVPRNQRPNPITSRLRSFGLLAVLGLGVIVTTALSALTTGVKDYGAHLGIGVQVAAALVGIAVNVGVFVLAFRVLTARTVSTHDLRLGAILAGVLWQVLQALGTYIVRHKLNGASEVYGLFGLVLGLIAWLYLEALLVVFCAEINVVRRHRLWPRALLTPFTDDVDLTDADRRAYTTYAGIERYKGYQDVAVSFARDPRAVARDGVPAPRAAAGDAWSEPGGAEERVPDLRRSGS